MHLAAGSGQERRAQGMHAGGCWAMIISNVTWVKWAHILGGRVSHQYSSHTQRS